MEVVLVVVVVVIIVVVVVVIIVVVVVYGGGSGSSSSSCSSCSSGNSSSSSSSNSSSSSGSGSGSSPTPASLSSLTLAMSPLPSLLLPFVSINSTVIVPLSQCNTTVSILTMYVSSRRRDTQHRPNIQSNSWLKHDIKEKMSSGRLLLMNVLTICLKQFLILLIFSHE